MFKYVLKRVLISLATLMVILFVLFLMLEFMPGSPFNDEKLTMEQIALLNIKYGLDKPVYIRFINYLKNMLKGDFGVSYSINKNFAVSSMVADRLPISIGIGLLAMVAGSVFGLLLGIIASLNHNTWIDNLCSAVSVLGVSIPSYVLALGLCYFISTNFKISVLYNIGEPIKSMILPALALSFLPMANIARFTRSEMIDVLGSDYILLVQSKGVKEHKLIFKHALRNALIPVITIMGPMLVGLLTGSMVIEKIFSIPGIGTLLIQGIQSNDYNVVIACSFIYSAMYIAVMLVVDILYGVIDPRIRVAKEGK